MRVPLIQGAYSARSIIASAQRCVNLYGEVNPPSSILELGGITDGGLVASALTRAVPAAPLTYYPTPGMKLLAPLSPEAPARGLYLATSGTLYYVAGTGVYTVSTAWRFNQVGSIGNATTPVSMVDNGTTLLLVDGSPNGYQIDLTTNAFNPVSAALNSPPATAAFAFYGADRADFLDGFVVLNQPGTRNFYCTYNNQIVFDATFFAAKNSWPDKLVSVIVTRRQIWLVGEKTSEIWFDAGNQAFPFQIVPGPFMQHGCVAKYSLAQNEGNVYFLSQDQAGINILVRGSGYELNRISNHSLETEWAAYQTTRDAVGFCFQQNGHSFYQINFPAADRSWRFDETTQEWHEPVYTDTNGVEHRHRAQCCASAYGRIVVGDYQTGSLYALDSGTYTDAGQAMVFRRGWPHLANQGKRVRYASFAADMECGDITGSLAPTPYFPILESFGLGFNIGTPAIPGTAPVIFLRWSDDRGRTFGNPIPQNIGSTGQYLTQPKWNRLGMARDRVFEIFGTIPGQIALNGAFIDVQACDT